MSRLETRNRSVFTWLLKTIPCRPAIVAGLSESTRLSMSFPCDFIAKVSDSRIERDRLTLCCSREEIVNAEEHEPQMALAEKNADYAAQSTVEIFNSGGEVRMKLESSESGALLSPAEVKVLNSFNISPLSDRTLLLESPFVRLFAEPVCNWFRAIGLYNFDPDKARSAVPVAGRSELETDGSNLALVLKKLLSDEDTSRSIRNLCQYNLPYLKDLRVEQLADSSYP